MNDYKELIDTLRNKDFDRDDEIFCTPLECGAFSIFDRAASTIESLQKENDELRIILDMYGREEGITEAFKKAEKLDSALKEIKYLKLVLKREGVTVLPPRFPGDRAKWNL